MQVGSDALKPYVLAGDIVGVGNGVLYATIIDTTSSSTKSSTTSNNELGIIDPTTGTVSQMIGSTGFPQLYGVAYALGKVFAFTHDGSGRVITIDPTTGKGTLFNTFTDPDTGKGISFSGAGVNSKVVPIT